MLQPQINAHADENSHKLIPNRNPLALAWFNLFAKNRMVSNRIAMAYIPPTVVDGNVDIQLDPMETAKVVEKTR